ncbi:MAG: hypothetical protein GY861_07875 [bacterium]|nr:hypothetical protein [bacterium]
MQKKLGDKTVTVEEELLITKSKSISPVLLNQAVGNFEEESSDLPSSSSFLRNPEARKNSMLIINNNTTPFKKNSPKNEEFGLVRKRFSTPYEKFKPVAVNSNSTGDIDSIIWNIAKNEAIIDNYKNDQNIKQLTNTEEIVDFYEYLQECLTKIQKIVPTPAEEIKTVDYELDKTKCKDYL